MGIIPQWARRWCLPPERDASRVGTGPEVRDLWRPQDGPPDCWRRHSDPCPQAHRRLCCASLGCAAPESYCPTLSADDQTSDAYVGLPQTYTNCNRVGPDRVSERRIPLLNGWETSTRSTRTGILGRSQLGFRSCVITPTETAAWYKGRIPLPRIPTHTTPPPTILI
jgi:hypothetical protein